VKIAGYSARGAFRGGRRLWPVLAAQDHSAGVQALRARAKAKLEDVVLAAQYVLALRERTVARRWRWGTALGLASAAALNYASLGLQFAAGCLMRGALSMIGWSDEAQIRDHGTPPLRIAMDSQQLNDAPRATSLLKQGKGDEDGPKVNCVMGPPRDGNGWAVVFVFTVDELQEAFLAVDDQECEEIINHHSLLDAGRTAHRRGRQRPRRHRLRRRRHRAADLLARAR
jgi:S-DNA-T family DNA segregation ATPase FtsK/SpoIIIE